MTKKIIAVFLCAAFCFGASACTSSGTSSADVPSSSDETSADSAMSRDESVVSAEASEEVSTPPVERTWPAVSGTFMQPGAFLSYTVDQWLTHFAGLKEVGIDIFIIQWTSETPYGKFKSCYYPSALTAGNTTADFADGSTLLERVLDAAQQSGIKVFVGLNLSDEWWSIACTQDAWNKTQSDLGIASANEIYSLYKEKYPDALYGWYFAWEMYNGMQGYETQAGSFLNQYLEPLKTLDASMPMMLSPFVRSYGSDAKTAGDEWTKVFETANFRDGDIFCCQDAVGAGHISIDQLEDYFKNLKRAVDTESGLHFWANTEDFTTDYNSAYLGRFVKQMNIAQPYVENYVTFAYSHYYAKDYNGKAGFHKAYQYYYNTGAAEAVLEKPQVTLTYNAESGRVVCKVHVVNDPYGIEKVVVSHEGTALRTQTVALTKLDEKEYDYTFTLAPEDNATSYAVDVTVNDFYGTEMTVSATVEIQ